MKKITILVIAICATFGAYAQFNQGRMLAGGTVEFQTSTSKYKNDATTVTTGRNTNFSLAPQFGYFIIDNLAVGAALDLALSKWNPENGDGESTGTSIALQPLVRYYLPQGVFFQGQFGIGSAKYKSDGFNNTEEKYNTLSWALSAGYALFLNDFVAVEPQIGYGSVRYKEKDSNIKELENGLFLRVGFQVYLGNK